MPERSKSLLLKAFLLFVAIYLVSLLLWIQVKDYYGMVVTYTVSHIMTLVKDVAYEGMTRDGNIIQTTFIPLRHKSQFALEIPVNTSSYTFNMPLTIAIISALGPFIVRKGRAYTEALVILFMVHLLYVFSLQAKELTDMFIRLGYEEMSRPRIFLYQFLWTFTDNMVIRFEPFLIGFYVYMRHRRKAS
jgi:hypothetical protein